MDTDALPKTARTNGYRCTRTGKNPFVDMLLDGLRDDILFVKRKNGLTWERMAEKLAAMDGYSGDRPTPKSVEQQFSQGGFRFLVRLAQALGLKVKLQAL